MRMMAMFYPPSGYGYDDELARVFYDDGTLLVLRNNDTMDLRICRSTVMLDIVKSHYKMEWSVAYLDDRLRARYLEEEAMDSTW
jgi:hypothetical protein